MLFSEESLKFGNLFFWVYRGWNLQKTLSINTTNEALFFPLHFSVSPYTCKSSGSGIFALKQSNCKSKPHITQSTKVSETVIRGQCLQRCNIGEMEGWWSNSSTVKCIYQCCCFFFFLKTALLFFLHRCLFSKFSSPPYPYLGSLVLYGCYRLKLLYRCFQV